MFGFWKFFFEKLVFEKLKAMGVPIKLLDWYTFCSFSSCFIMIKMHESLISSKDFVMKIWLTKKHKQKQWTSSLHQKLEHENPYTIVCLNQIIIIFSWFIAWLWWPFVEERKRLTKIIFFDTFNFLVSIWYYYETYFFQIYSPSNLE